MDWKHIFEVGDGTRGPVHRRPIIRGSSKIDRLLSHKIGPIATRNLRISRHFLWTIGLFFIVGIFGAGHNGVFGDLEVGYNGVDEIALGDFFGFITRVVGLGALGIEGDGFPSWGGVSGSYLFLECQQDCGSGGKFENKTDSALLCRRT